MSYTPTNWTSGDVITAEKLNKLEGGVAGAGGGATIVTLTFSRNPSDTSKWTATGNITFEELKPIAENGGAIVLRGDFNGDGGSVSKSAYAYEVFADGVNLYVGSGYDVVTFGASSGEQLHGGTV